MPYSIATHCLILRLSLALCLLSSEAYAASPSPWWMTVEGGYAFNTASAKTTVEPMPKVLPPNDNYVSQAPQNTGLLGIGASYQFTLPERQNFPTSWLRTDRLGLFYDYYLPTTINGAIYKSQGPSAPYTYQYTAVSNVVWLDNQTDIISWRNLTPFIDIAVGGAFNRSSAYGEAAVSPYPPRINAAFANQTDAQWAWRAGAGIDYLLPLRNTPLHLGLAYRYSDLGNVSTGKASATYPTMTQVLTQHLVANEVILSLRYAV